MEDVSPIGWATWGLGGVFSAVLLYFIRDHFHRMETISRDMVKAIDDNTKSTNRLSRRIAYHFGIHLDDDEEADRTPVHGVPVIDGPGVYHRQRVRTPARGVKIRKDEEEK